MVREHGPQPASGFRILHAHHGRPMPEARAGLSTAHFTVVLRREIGATPPEYLTQRRIEAAGRALLEPGATITRVAHAFGFSTSQYFSLVFRKVQGCTPRDWRLRGGR